MTIEGANKMAPPAATKGQEIRYVGHKVSVHCVVNGRTHRFPRNAAVAVPPAVATELLKQPGKFQPASVPARDAKELGKPYPVTAKEK